MHGARNDFVILDRRAQSIDDPVAFARWICDRRSGIGADGVLTIETSTHADARMRVINADGSEAEMCGNGIRCVARYLAEAGEGEGRNIETLAGTIQTRVESHQPEYLVRVRMAAPAIAAYPSQADADLVDTGNPHVVVFRDAIDLIDLEALAAIVQRDPALRSGANVHLVAASDGSLHVRHWERGVGVTQACGTGAVAAAAAAIARGLAHAPVTVHVPGGTLTVSVDGDGGWWLTGPAERVFDTDVAVEAPISR
jgi:diaminopimelate epimerase